MKITILTLFPTFFDSPFSMGVIDGAIKNSSIDIEIVNIRDYGMGLYRKCDDTTYGGGAGMLMTASIFKNYFESNVRGYTLLFTPTGTPLTQASVKHIAYKEHITLILGHYEGVDSRIEEVYADESISIGDYVLSGGEIPALVLIDAISRYKGVLGNEQSVHTDTFEAGTGGLLEYEQYTKPQTISLEGRDLTVPSVLLSGYHKNINSYRRSSSLIRTFLYRRDLFSKAALNKKDIATIFDYLKTNTSL